VGAVAVGAAGFSTMALPLRSSRIGALIFWWACVMYRSNSWSLAWRPPGCPGTAGPLSTIGSPSRPTIRTLIDGAGGFLRFEVPFVP
jgi:hypothetical protein